MKFDGSKLIGNKAINISLLTNGYEAYSGCLGSGIFLKETDEELNWKVLILLVKIAFYIK